MPNDNENQLGQEKRQAVIALVDGKKKESTKQDAIDFERAWLSYVEESGLCDDSIGLLYDGFSITGASPLFCYLNSHENECDLKTLKKMPLVKENPQGATFRLLVHLLALYMNQGKSCEQILYLVQIIPAFATNKAGSPFGTNFNTIRKYLVRSLVPGSAEASLEGLDCHSRDLAKLAAIISPVLSEMKQNSKETKKGAASVELLAAWLSSANDMQQNMAPVASGETQERVASAQTQASFDEAIAVLKSLKRDDDALKAKLASLQSEIATEKSTSERRKSEIEKLRLDLEASRCAFDKQSLALRTAHQEIERLSSELQAVEADAKNQASLVAMLDGDQSRKSEALLNKIASKLKTDYEDYQDAIDMEMSSELGANMRFQLGEVFNILKSIGVPL